MMSQTIKSIAPPLPTCPHHEFSKAQLTNIPSHLLNEKLLRSRANLSPSQATTLNENKSSKSPLGITLSRFKRSYSPSMAE